MSRLTANELDAVGREGLSHVLAFFRNGDAVSEKKAAMCMKVVGQGAKRLSIEVAAVGQAYRMAKAANYSPEQFTFLIALLASGEAVPDALKALAASKPGSSSESKQTAMVSGAQSKAKRQGRSRRTA
jgi:hypothetical protein